MIPSLTHHASLVRACLLISVLSLTFTACTPEPVALQQAPFRMDDELQRQIEVATAKLGLEGYVMPHPEDLPNVPADPKNPLTPEKVRLGRWLYHETGLALDAKRPEGVLTYSCASCHHAPAGFQANRRQGIGDGGSGFGRAGEGRFKDANYEPSELDVQPIRTPTVLNVAFQEVMLWNGQFGATGANQGTEAAWTAGTPKALNHLGYQGVEIQAIAGLEVHRLRVDRATLADLGYLDEFDRVFADFPESERYTRETAGLAIAAYERTLLPDQAPFQRWLRGDTEALTYRQKFGGKLFFGEAGCANCHHGPGLNGPGFYALGMPDLMGPEIFNSPLQDPAHLGRGGFTGNMDDLYKFKVPQLYNLKDSPFLGHGGTFRSVREVIEYKNAARPENLRVSEVQLADGFTPLNLTPEEIDALVDFVENALYDPQLQRFEPRALPSGLCFPNADERSRQDMGCD